MSEVPAVPRTPALIARVARAFADDGPLARTLADFEPRPGQREMAEAVADAFESGGILLAEGGTGTGKTLAYLVPAILSRQRVLISTGTKNLQEQIYFKDLPLLRQALGIPFTASYMKGRGNYLCLHRYHAFRSGGWLIAPSGALDRAELEEWAARTETGDRAELEDLPEDLPFWNELAATAENCLGSKCPRWSDCYITRMRQRAAESDLVIVNHHLLCADAAVRQSAYGEVIPECRYAVIDEAHQLEDVATQYFGTTLSNHRLEDLARDADLLLDARAVEDDYGELRRAVGHLRDRARGFFFALDVARDAAGPGAAAFPGAEERVRLGPRIVTALVEPGQMLMDALVSLAATLALRPGASEDALAVRHRAEEMRDQLEHLLRADDPDYVYYLERRGRGLFLRASPIDVSAIVRELLLDRMQATVLTSATLTAGGSFDYIRDRLGIRRGAEIRLPSEFDFARQAVLYLPPRIPDPRSSLFPDAAAREVIEILKRTRGRAFVLFTSYAVLRVVQEAAEAVLDYPLFVQGSAPRSVLLQQFRTTPNAVLLATSSFWQGVDVMGEALSCVIVDKLPFAPPGIPSRPHESRPSPGGVGSRSRTTSSPLPS